MFRAPASEDIARFVGVETIVDGVIVDVDRGLAVLEAGGHAFEVAADARPGSACGCAFDPKT